MSCDAAVVRGIGDRPEQQDAYGLSNAADAIFVEHGGVAGVVADGMGGLSLGAFSARTAVTAFLQEYHLKRPEDPIPQVLQRAVEQAHRAVYDISAHKGGIDEEGSGSTLVAVVLKGLNLHWISSGDSRAYLVRGSHLFQLTVDHNYAAELAEDIFAGRIGRDEAARHPEREHLTSFVGMLGPLAMDRSILPFVLSPGDRILLCTDGVYRALPEDAIAACCAEGACQTCCESLLESVKGRRISGQDNYTAMLMAPLSEGTGQ